MSSQTHPERIPEISSAEFDLLVAGYTLRLMARRAVAAFDRMKLRPRLTPRWINNLRSYADTWDRHARRIAGDEFHDKWTRF